MVDIARAISMARSKWVGSRHRSYTNTWTNWESRAGSLPVLAAGMIWRCRLSSSDSRRLDKSVTWQPCEWGYNFKYLLMIVLTYVGSNWRDNGYGYQWWSIRSGNYHYNLAWGHGGQQIVLLDE